VGPAGYQNLYIYFLKGVLRERHEGSLGDSFLGNWVEEDSSFLFFSEPAGKLISKLLRVQPNLELVDTYSFTYEQWQGAKPEILRIDQFLLVPPWEKEGRAEGHIRITLDPGVVFGNGLHPTTRDCLRALAFAARERPLGSVLDLGTGSGVLAVAAALLGAERVLAIDLNPLCAKTARRNAELNHLQEAIEVVAGKAEDFLRERADLVVGNLHYELIRDLLENRSFDQGERVLLSGLMRTQARDVRARLIDRGFQITGEWDHEMTWFTYVASKEEEAGARRSLPGDGSRSGR